MKRFDTKMKFLLTKKQKNQIKKRAIALDLSMSEYLRSLARIDEKINEIELLNDKLQNKINQLDNIKNKIGGEFLWDK